MKKIKTSAPGKLMLLGDHAVVYGEPCVVTAVDERLQVEIEPSEKFEILAPQVKDTRFVEESWRVFREKHPAASAIRITTQSPFSGKFGFGSSSAVTVATLKALVEFFEIQLKPKELFDLAYQVIMEVQGVGSGFDAAAAVYGGTLYFKKGGVAISPLAASQLSQLPIVVGYSGVKSNTVEIVNRVADMGKIEPDKCQRIMVGIGKLVEQAIGPLNAGEWERVGTLMNMNQDYLRDLGVSSEKLENLIFAAKKAGAWGAKLSGAGGGDCMIAIVAQDKRSAIEAAITQAGGEVLPVTLHAPGVRVEM